MNKHDLVIIGGGPAGMAAAIAAAQNNIQDILIIERDPELGGILNQCIHNGFGLHRFKKELTGPEYSNLFIQELSTTKVRYLTNTTVLKIEPNHIIHTISSEQGYTKIQAQAIILAMGCRERTRGAIRIHGSRPAGVYTAGTAQKLVNLEGILPGNRVVIIGSGDIGLIMARRMTLEGAKVAAVVEILPHSNGLSRNINQCLNDFGIPLLLNTTITKIHGQERVTGVTIAEVDESLSPLEATERFIPCDTVLLAIGLIPENELSRAIGVELDPKIGGPIVGESRQTSIPGIFACGNVLQVHDLVDFVSLEGELAGCGAAKYINQQLDHSFTHTTLAADGISYIVPQKINLHNVTNTVKLFMRVKNAFENSLINVYSGNKIIACKKELKFLPAEMVTLDLHREDLVNSSEKELIVKVETIK